MNDEKVLKEILNRKIGIIGLGQMGNALLIAFSKYLKKYNVDLDDIFYLCDPVESKKDELSSYGFKNFSNKEEIIFKKTKIILICVKPDSIEGLLKRNILDIKSDTLLVSIAAGISIDYLTNIIKSSQNEINTKEVLTPKIIRIMANHLCMINESASVYSVNSLCDKTDENIISTLLSNVGSIKKVEEKLMNTFTAVNGSGPAFVYYFAESLIDAALKNGVDITTARESVIQVLYGASKYLKDSKEKNPNNLKYIVTTPNGTTIAGLSQLDKHNFKHAVNEAITFATKRGAEIEKEKMKIFAKSKF